VQPKAPFIAPRAVQTLKSDFALALQAQPRAVQLWLGLRLPEVVRGPCHPQRGGREGARDGGTDRSNTMS